MTVKSRLDVEALEQSLISLRLQRENDRLRQAVDFLTRAHAKLTEDLTLKNSEIVQSEMCCGDLKLQVAELSEKVKLAELELAEFKRDSSHYAVDMLELSAECVGLRGRISAADSDIAALRHELDSHTYSEQQTQVTISDLKEQLSAKCKKTQLLAEKLSEEQNKLMLQQDEVIAASAKNVDLTVHNAGLQQKLELVEEECSKLQLSLNEHRETADDAKEELHRQMQCLQNDYQLNLQSLNIKYEILQLRCDQLTTENTSLKLQVVDEREHTEMQAKIDKLEQALQDTVKALGESRKITDECLCEKAVVQNKLIDAESERDCLRVELDDCSVRYQHIEHSLLELQETLVQHDKQIKEKDFNLNHVQQQTAYFRETLIALQQQLQQEQFEKMERKQRVKKLKEEIENLKENITTQRRTVADVLAAKEESDRRTASLQVQADHLTSEKVNLEQQVRLLEDNNSSLQKDLLTVTENCEDAKKLITELQLRVDQLCAHEQNLSDELSSLRLLCEQKDEVIGQLNSEKETIRQSLDSVSQKADGGAVEITAHIRRISELEKHNAVVADEVEKLSADKQMLVDDLNMRKDVVEQQKQLIADAKHKNDCCHKVISGFEEQSLRWRDEELVLECRILELENCVTSKEEEIQAMHERQEVEETNIDNHPLVKNSESVEVSDKAVKETDRHHVLPRHEVIWNLDTVKQKAEESDMEMNVYDFSASVHLHPEPDSGNLRECRSLSINLQENCKQSETEKPTFGCMMLKAAQVMSYENELEGDSPVEVAQVHSNMKFLSGMEKVNLQQVLSENAVMQQKDHFEPGVNRALERADASDSLSDNDKNVARDSAYVDWSKQCNLHVATGSDGSAEKEQFSVRNIVHSNSAVAEVTKDTNVAVADSVSKRKDLVARRGGQRRVIKCFTRLTRSSAASKHNSKPLTTYNSDVPALHTQAGCSLDMNIASVANAVERLPDGNSSESNATLSSNVSAINLQDNTSNIPISVPANGMATDNTVCSVDIHSVTDTASSVHLSACEQFSCPHAISKCSQATSQSGHRDNENRNASLNTESECPVSQNVFANVDNSSDDKSDPVLQPSSKRLKTDVNGDEPKKIRFG